FSPLAGAAMPPPASSTRSTKAKTSPANGAATPDPPKAQRTRGEKKQDQQQKQRRSHGKRKQRAAARAEGGRQTQQQAQEKAQAERGALPLVNRHAAGIDIGARSHWVCIDAEGEEADCVRECPTHTAGLQAILDGICSPCGRRWRAGSSTTNNGSSST